MEIATVSQHIAKRINFPVLRSTKGPFFDPHWNRLPTTLALLQWFHFYLYPLKSFRWDSGRKQQKKVPKREFCITCFHLPAKKPVELKPFPTPPVGTLTYTSWEEGRAMKAVHGHPSWAAANLWFLCVAMHRLSETATPLNILLYSNQSRGTRVTSFR